MPLAGDLCEGMLIALGWPEPHEFDALTAMRNRPEVRSRFLDPRPLEAEANRQWLATGMQRPVEGLLSIRLRASGALCGMIGWSHWDPLDASVEIGRLVVDHRLAVRQLRAAGIVRSETYPGIGVDATNTLRDFLFESLGLRTMFAVYIGDNARSARVNRLGGGRLVATQQVARRDGSSVTLVRAELSRDEWLAVRKKARA